MNSLIDSIQTYLAQLSPEKAVDLLRYQPDSPMLFSSGLFFFLFIGFFIIYMSLRKNTLARIVYVTLFSLFFYYKSSGLWFGLLILTATSDYWIGRLLELTSTIWKKKLLVTLSLCVNLGMLGYFKYFNFLYESIVIAGNEIGNLFGYESMQQLSYQKLDIFLPVGLSFFTFQSISYIVDIYRGKTTVLHRWIDYLFYVSFFPMLVAGPIVRAREFIPQMYKSPTLSRSDFGEGFYLVLCGLFKKAVISDYISFNFVDRVFDSPLLYTGVENLLAVYGYALQIYCDFSGYSDMAIGVGKMLGFNTIENFNYPYIASSVRDFWRRWHISLSTWFRDYVYIPLGGSRKGKRRTYSNIFIVFLLTGLWHGATSNFVIWGLYYAFFLVIERAGFEKILNRHSVIAHIYSVVVILFGWVIFKISNITDIAIYFKHMLCPWKYGWYPQQFVWNISVKTVIITIVALLGCGVIQTFIAKYCKMKARWNKGIGSPVFCGFIMFLCIIELSNNTYYPFIYFNF